MEQIGLLLLYHYFLEPQEKDLLKKKMIEKPITVQMLKSAKKIALLNAMIDFDILDEYTIEV